jgi:hypothetical protein
MQKMLLQRIDACIDTITSFHYRQFSNLNYTLTERGGVPGLKVIFPVGSRHFERESRKGFKVINHVLPIPGKPEVIVERRYYSLKDGRYLVSTLA